LQARLGRWVAHEEHCGRRSASGRSPVRSVPFTLLIVILTVFLIASRYNYFELQDAKVRRDIEISCQEYLAGKSRPAEEFFKELEEEEKSRCRIAFP
jgi:hypothetical protein